MHLHCTRVITGHQVGGQDWFLPIVDAQCSLESWALTGRHCKANLVISVVDKGQLTATTTYAYAYAYPACSWVQNSKDTAHCSLVTYYWLMMEGGPFGRSWLMGLVNIRWPVYLYPWNAGSWLIHVSNLMDDSHPFHVGDNLFHAHRIQPKWFWMPLKWNGMEGVELHIGPTHLNFKLLARIFWGFILN